jgi:hypothetical protein
MPLVWSIAKPRAKSPEMLRYTDLEEAIRLARAAGMNTIQIVRALSGSVPYAEALQIAGKAAPLLRITVKAFLWSSEEIVSRASERLQPRDQLRAVAFLREPVVIDFAFFAQHFVFDRAEKPVSCIADDCVRFFSFGFTCD